jgi:hypothetical protein
MRKIIFLLSIVAITTSCMDQFKKQDERHVSYGNLKFDSPDWYIYSDKGNRLNIVVSEVTGFEFSENLRVVAKYSIVGDPIDTVYNIHIYEIEEVLCKDPLTPSLLTQTKIDSLGRDPVNIIEAWFGGDKYLNITFELLRYDANKVHHVNLVLDEEETTENNLVFEFRHNAFKDPTYYNAYGRISYDISSYIPANLTEIVVTLKWTDYYMIDRSMTGTFYLPTNNSGHVVTPEVK